MNAPVSSPTEFRTHADPMDTQAPAPTGLSLLGWGRWAWRRLITMRTALILLLLLALAAIPGSLFPQRTSDPLAVNAYFEANPSLAPVLDALAMFDVYGSAWFSAIYLLLFISLVGCVLPRTRLHWRALRAGPPEPPKNLSRIEHVQIEAAEPDAALGAVANRLKKGRWRVKSGDGWVSAEKGVSRETGNEIFHLGLLVVLIAIAWGALAGWNGNVVIREGNGFSNTVSQYDTFTAGRFADLEAAPAFSLDLDDFAVDFDRSETQRGTPLNFDATVTTTVPGETPVTQQLGVNEPVEVDGTKVFLIGHGYAPRVVVKDSEGQVRFDDSVVFLPRDPEFTSTGVVKVPDITPQLGLRGLFLPTAAVFEETGPISTFPAPDDPGLFVSAFTGDLGLDAGEPQSIFTLDSENMQQIGLESMRVGDTWELPDNAGSVEFAGYDRWISVKVAHDPGGLWALIAIGVALLGLTASLFIRRRRIWVVADEESVIVAGAARGENQDMEPEVSALAEHLAQSHRPTSKGGIQ
ncbi:MAG: cytochrome c biogenesis protein ResB [Actinomycetia bacterium]|nr:cytochrome c biogenesis protein ResB [Actinomycetes bacterium]